MNTPPLNYKEWKSLSTYGLYVLSYIDIVYTKPMENIISYVTYRELFPEEKNTLELLKNLYGDYFVRNITQFLCKLYYIHSQKYSGVEADFVFANTLLVALRASTNNWADSAIKTFNFAKNAIASFETVELPEFATVGANTGDFEHWFLKWSGKQDSNC